MAKRSTKRRGLKRLVLEKIRRGVLFTSRWTEANKRLLGTMSDEKLARKIGLTKTAVFNMRRALGIPPAHVPSRQKLVWKPQHLKALGRVPDAQIAREMNVDPGVVRRKRDQLKIAPFRKTRARNPWKAKELTLLGKYTDGEVAAMTGRSRRSVCEQRRKLGIPPKTGTVPVQPWTPRWEKKLGKVSDRELSAMSGISVARIRQRRVALGIPSARGWLPFSWTEDKILELFHTSDEAFAKKYRLSVPRVARRRAFLQRKLNP